MLDYHAEAKIKAANPKKALSINIPKGLIQTLILAMVTADALLIVFLSQWGMEQSLELRIGAGVVIGFAHMYSFIVYRMFLRWMWDVE